MVIMTSTGFHSMTFDDNFTSVLSTTVATSGVNSTLDHAITTLQLWQNWYQPIHGYAAPIVCIFGVIANTLNFVVLTSNKMHSLTNVILSGLAVSDGLTMAAYFPYVILNYHVYISRPSPQANAVFLMFYAIFSVIVHSISIWLTVALALFRYIFIRYPRRGAKLCTIYRAKLTIVIVSVVTAIVCIPNCVIYTIAKFDDPKTNVTIWYIDVKERTTTEIFVKNLNFWTQALLVKLLPCFMLSILSICLVNTMKGVEERRQKLRTNRHTVKSEDENKRHRKTNRTTRMLLTVAILFLVTETPQGVLQLFSGIINGFFTDVYHPLGDLMDILALINNGINFALYCTMSKRFRDTFIKIFLKGVIKNRESRVTSFVPTQATKDTDF